MILLDGKKVRDARTEVLRTYIKSADVLPHLVIIQVGDNPVSSAYIEQKKKFGASIGAEVSHICLDSDVSGSDIQKIIQEYNNNLQVHGIIVQLPLPAGILVQEVIDSISPKKDVDGLTSLSVQKLAEGNPLFVPATARGILSLLNAYDIDLKDKQVVVIGRSALVGRPVAQLLSSKGAHVDVCHRQTKDIPSHTRKADILVVAAGHPHLVGEEYVSAGQVVVDVGINTYTGEHLDEELPHQKYVGDVDFKNVSEKVAYISPVPGGVGPMTVLSLFENLIEAHKK